MYVHTDETLTVSAELLTALRSCDGLMTQGVWNAVEDAAAAEFIIRKDVDIPGFGLKSAEKSISVPVDIIIADNLNERPISVEFGRVVDGGTFDFLRDSLQEGDRLKLTYAYHDANGQEVVLQVTRDIKTRGRGASKTRYYSLILGYGEFAGNVTFDSEIVSEDFPTETEEIPAKSRRVKNGETVKA